MKRGSIYIIPDEKKILDDCFYRDVFKGHLLAIKEFSDFYRLNYDFANDDSFEAPCILASDGHLVIEIDNDFSSIIFYIPEVVDDRQNIWVCNKRDSFINYKFIGGYKVKRTNDGFRTKEIKGLNNIIKEINYGNVFYNRKESDRHVR